MDVQQQEHSVASKTVLATLNYGVPTNRRPLIHNDELDKIDVTTEPHAVSIYDAGTWRDVSLDIEGFTCVAHTLHTGDLPDSPETVASYRSGMESLILELTGADEVLLLPFHVVRRQELSDGGDHRNSTTAWFVHTDVTLAGRAGVEEIFYQRPADPEVRRTAHYNMWQLLSPGPTNRPLALCDASSVRESDIIAGDSVFSSGISFETALVRYNSSHRWAYFPELTSREVLVFKQGDSDPTYPRLVPHTAFDDTLCSAAAPRVSLELRCMAIWH